MKNYFVDMSHAQSMFICDHLRAAGVWYAVDVISATKARIIVKANDLTRAADILTKCGTINKFTEL